MILNLRSGKMRQAFASLCCNFQHRRTKKKEDQEACTKTTPLDQLKSEKLHYFPQNYQIFFPSTESGGMGRVELFYEVFGPVGIDLHNLKKKNSF